MASTDYRQMSHLCARIGEDRLIVQGGGGNASWKDDNLLWVKASGTRLADAMAQDIFVSVDLAHLQAALLSGDYDVAPRVIDERGLRPSIETLLHGLMPQKYVLHVHAIDPLALLVRRDAAARLEKCLPDDLSWRLVGYHKPGAELAAAISQAADDLSQIDVVFMASHGIVVAADTLREVEEKLYRVLQATKQMTELMKEQNGYQLSDGTTRSINADLPQNISAHYAFAEDGQMNALACDPQLFALCNSHWVMYPDHAIFLGARPVCASQDALASIDEQNAEVILLEGVGVLFRQDARPAVIEQLQCYVDVVARLDMSSPLNVLSDEDIGDLLNWDAEKYRQMVSATNS